MNKSLRGWLTNTPTARASSTSNTFSRNERTRLTRSTGGSFIAAWIRRRDQIAGDPASCLRLARAFVAGKIRNCRTLLRRNARELPDGVLHRLAESRRRAERAVMIEQLLGIEGTEAREYFNNFAPMFKPDEDADTPTFEFAERNRRPPRGPVNALLSFPYTMLVKDMVATLVGVGFDPYLGFYHQPKYGRPALALDLMEEFRPLMADSVAVGMINNGGLRQSDFITRAGAVAMTDSGRRRVIEAYERRMDTLVMIEALSKIINHREDQVMLVDIGPADGRGQWSIETIGRAPDHYRANRIAVIV